MSGTAWNHTAELPVPDLGSEGRKEAHMNKHAIAVAVTAGLAAGLIGSGAPAAAAPDVTGNAQQTIDDLRAQGYRVIVSRLSSKPLAEANVVGVRHGQDFSQNWIVDDEDRDYVYNALAVQTIYVDVN
jgi:hypothetical protein